MGSLLSKKFTSTTTLGSSKSELSLCFLSHWWKYPLQLKKLDPTEWSICYLKQEWILRG
jgi:hypothetical protein